MMNVLFKLCLYIFTQAPLGLLSLSEVELHHLAKKVSMRRDANTVYEVSMHSCIKHGKVIILS